ncbi:hypothetical protein EYF80_047055 [Liparis tanakae]|uniref:Uncharacterized protein n=1 Tax=Liparis tanakae TaxID=230148 RepID=A0A4Z2FNQ2_9TELE|nr:hypothetical protein EYF80_047055 [Liparis tanakae]
MAIYLRWRLEASCGRRIGSFEKGEEKSAHFVRSYYLFRPTQGRGAGEQDGPFGALDEGRQNLGSRRVPGFEVVRLVHHDHGEPLPAQSLHQGARVRGHMSCLYMKRGDAAQRSGAYLQQRIDTHEADRLMSPGCSSGIHRSSSSIQGYFRDEGTTTRRGHSFRKAYATAMACTVFPRPIWTTPKKNRTGVCRRKRLGTKERCAGMTN